MPGARKETAPVLFDALGYTGRAVELGDFTVSFDNFRNAVDASPVFRGLPDHRCQSPHWGVVMRGRVTLRYGNYDETFETGDVFQALPGHVPVVDAGTELLSFSPRAELEHVNAVVSKNLKLIMAAGGTVS